MAQAIARLRGDLFDKWWPQITEQLDTIPHTWERWWTKESMYHAIQQGWSQCWAACKNESIELVVITSILEYPSNNKILVTNLTFGRNLDEHIHLVEATLENFAREMECMGHEVRGRRGWEPRLKRLGFEFQQIVMYKPIESRRH